MWYGKRPVRSKSVGPALAVLFLVNVLNFYDRQTLAAILEPLRHEFSLSDTQLGGLFTLFTVVFALAGLPLRKLPLSLIHISEPTRLGMISYAVFCLKKK